MTRKSDTRPILPDYVQLDRGRWFVVKAYPSKDFYADGTRKYIRVKRRCLPETAWRAAQVLQEIEVERRMAVVEHKRSSSILGDYLRRFLAAKQGAVARRTYEIYEIAFERFVFGNGIAEWSLSDLTPIMLQDHASLLIAKGTSVYSVREFFDNLKAALAQAVKWELLERNPATALILPKPRKKDIVAMDKDQARDFLAACEGHQDRLVFEFALETGMRPGEYLALRWRDVDLERRTVTVRQAIATNLKGGDFEIKEPKTKGSRRTIDISERLASKLSSIREAYISKLNYLKTLAENAEVNGCINLTHIRPNRRPRAIRTAQKKLAVFRQYDLVFPSAIGSPLSRLNLGRREFADTLKDAGLDKCGFTLYSLRHTSATLSLLAGVNVKGVSERLGHASVTLTLDTYAHFIPAMRDDAVAKLSAMLFSDLPVLCQDTDGQPPPEPSPSLPATQT